MPRCDLCDCAVELVFALSGDAEWPAEVACEWCLSNVIGDDDAPEAPLGPDACCGSFCALCV